MSDGRILEEDGPSFIVHFRGMGGGQYERKVAIFGPGKAPATIDIWCYVYDSLRTYSVANVLSVEEMDGGRRMTGEDFASLLSGRPTPDS